ncbi:hydrogenase maturation protein [Neptuniibacter caesariensis]|uniref:Enoyl-CoA hydratase/isomerase:Formyl transferase, N-terminal:Formyltransferase, C-terminal n=1 Tax=Neptuniibacter caesariensis TaxID=207954 RepID=A0A7U8GS00_NEPCE|nr:hydrogenase maturation protein [Neptuniibacter caesariensis]EAR61962.1 Enoyl-CoA hydratase/isomerase:Formyl transferase, N-terminal:Formyltransferase, C-terminal [Oceanospirillum sp. MED92] [Neptuniibacter caesariensis]
MRILFLTHSFNSLSQRLFVELGRDGHDISIEFDINDSVTEQAVELYKPDMILAPFLKRAIPESVWSQYRCIIVHPGIVGDRGPSSVDWAIMRNEQRWGVTCLEANAEMDAGDIWASVEFPMRAASKSSLYRNEVTDAAVKAVRLTIERMQTEGYQPQALDYANPDVQGQWHCLMKQSDRVIDWQVDSTEVVLRKIRAADSVPGVKDEIAGREYYLYNAFAAEEMGDLTGEPGSIVATRDRAICLKTRDGAVWVTHLKVVKPDEQEFGFKLPATQVLAAQLQGAPEAYRVPEIPATEDQDEQVWQEIRYRQEGRVGYLHFDFYNGAMDTYQCKRLQRAVALAKQQEISVLVLMGGREFWSNGIHLNQIEAANSPAEESWQNINAMNDLCREIIDSPDQITMVAMQGNAGAGGVFLALAADRVIAHDKVVLNPHYKSMGNLYGSEYWTYLLPKRVGEEQAKTLMQNRLPVSAKSANAQGLIDQVFEGPHEAFIQQVRQLAEEIADSDISSALRDKHKQRTSDEQAKSLQIYRDEELAQMKLNFFGFDPSYHVARYHFVEKLPKARTPVYLAKHRAL